MLCARKQSERSKPVNSAPIRWGVSVFQFCYRQRCHPKKTHTYRSTHATHTEPAGTLQRVAHLTRQPRQVFEAPYPALVRRTHPLPIHPCGNSGIMQHNQQQSNEKTSRVCAPHVLWLAHGRITPGRSLV